MTSTVKTFVLDTNIMVHDPEAIFKFAENHVVLAISTVEELDGLKKASSDVGRNARQALRLIDQLIEEGRVGSPTVAKELFINDSKGTFEVVLLSASSKYALPMELDWSIADNRILSVALQREAILVTNDVNLRIKANAVGIIAQKYENDRVSFDELYTGITNQYDEKFYPNQYVQFFDAEGNLERAARYDATLEMLVPVRDDLEAWGLNPANEEQRYAMDLLLNDDIKLVTLVGQAGVGKTLVAIAAALRQVTDDFVFKKVLVSRPVMPMGKDIGFLPGDIGEKYAPYMQPIVDNVEYLMQGYKSPPVPKVRGKKKNQEVVDKEDGILPKGYHELVAAGIMEMEPLLYIRGRSIPNVIMIVDESQSLSPHEVKTIVTRAGIGTKLVFTGDPAQIDNPYLDASNNGLTYLVEKMKSEAIAGHVTLTKGERSELADIAARIL